MAAQGRHLRRIGGSEAAIGTLASRSDVFAKTPRPHPDPLAEVQLPEAKRPHLVGRLKKKTRPGGDDRACSRA
jgi:hypothetical protein